MPAPTLTTHLHPVRAPFPAPGTDSTVVEGQSICAGTDSVRGTSPACQNTGTIFTPVCNPYATNHLGARHFHQAEYIHSDALHHQGTSTVPISHPSAGQGPCFSSTAISPAIPRSLERGGNIHTGPGVQTANSVWSQTSSSSNAAGEVQVLQSFEWRQFPVYYEPSTSNSAVCPWCRAKGWSFRLDTDDSLQRPLAFQTGREPGSFNCQPSLSSDPASFYYPASSPAVQSAVDSARSYHQQMYAPQFRPYPPSPSPGTSPRFGGQDQATGYPSPASSVNDEDNTGDRRDIDIGIGIDSRSEDGDDEGDARRFCPRFALKPESTWPRPRQQAQQQQHQQQQQQQHREFEDFAEHDRTGSDTDVESDGTMTDGYRGGDEAEIDTFSICPLCRSAEGVLLCALCNVDDEEDWPSDTE